MDNIDTVDKTSETHLYFSETITVLPSWQATVRLDEGVRSELQNSATTYWALGLEEIQPYGAQS